MCVEGDGVVCVCGGGKMEYGCVARGAEERREKRGDEGRGEGEYVSEYVSEYGTKVEREGSKDLRFNQAYGEYGKKRKKKEATSPPDGPIPSLSLVSPPTSPNSFSRRFSVCDAVICHAMIPHIIQRLT